MQQAGYQVRFDFGVEGLDAIGSGADVIIVTDALTSDSADTAAVISASDDIAAHASVVVATLVTSLVAAEWVREHQEELSRRLAIVVVTASSRYSVDDFLCAGAVIARLSDLGLDATSPEAAAAEAAYRSLAPTLSHVITASVSGRRAQPSREATRPDPHATRDIVRFVRVVRSSV